MNRTWAAAAPPRVIGGLGSDFTEQTGAKMREEH